MGGIYVSEVGGGMRRKTEETAAGGGEEGRNVPHFFAGPPHIRMNYYSNSHPLPIHHPRSPCSTSSFVHFAPGPSHRYPCRFGLQPSVPAQTVDLGRWGFAWRWAREKEKDGLSPRPFCFDGLPPRQMGHRREVYPRGQHPVYASPLHRCLRRRCARVWVHLYAGSQ